MKNLNTEQLLISEPSKCVSGNLFTMANEFQFSALPDDIKEMFDQSTGSESDRDRKIQNRPNGYSDAISTVINNSLF